VVVSDAKAKALAYLEEKTQARSKKQRHKQEAKTQAGSKDKKPRLSGSNDADSSSDN
jgi:hypothetical protein